MMASDEVIQPSSDSFWEVDCYKRTVKRQDDGYKLCSELMQLIQERGHIEKEYAKQLKGWGKKWTDLIDKGPEYGTSELACKAVMQEAECVADLHLEVKERLVNDVHNTIKAWRTENYHKSMVGQCKETKELEDGFKKAQKPWAKRYQGVLTARKQYHRACKALQAAEDQSDQVDSGSRQSLSFAQKPWAKRYSKVMKARKDYHSAVKQEKTATNQENNSKNDTGMSLDQQKKLQERVEKCRRDVENTKGKYEEALNEINSYNAKYMEDMTEVFVKCQDAEEKRLKFFKEMLFGIHKCLDLSVNPAFGNIYTQLKQSIGMADCAKDLKWWSEHHGVDMAMNWPTFEDYAPEPHTISRKEKKGGNNEAVSLTFIKQNNTPTHVASQQQSYSNFSADEQTPPPSASSQVSQNRPPPKPLRKQESYDPSLNPFTDDTDNNEGESGPMPSPSQSKGSSRVSVNSQSEGASHKSQSSIDTNPFADDMDDEDDDVLTSPKPSEGETSMSSVKLRKPDEKGKAANYSSAERLERTESDRSENSPRVGSFSYDTAPATPEKPVHRKKGLAPRVPIKTETDNGSALDEWADDAGSGMEEVMRVPVRALYDYTGQEEDELSFKSGDVFIKLKNEDDQGWCVGEKEGHVGLYPRDYVEVI